MNVIIFGSRRYVKSVVCDFHVNCYTECIMFRVLNVLKIVCKAVKCNLLTLVNGILGHTGIECWVSSCIVG